MACLPKAREVIQVVRQLGFSFVRQRWSHAIYRNNGTRITIPVHPGKEISPAVFRQILKDLNLTTKKFWQL